MMISLSEQNVIPLKEACKLLPKRRSGKKPHVATLYRWADPGLRGVRLETLQVGDTLCTSPEALQEFCERLTKDVAQPVTTDSRKREIAAAEAELDAAGI